MTEALSIQKVQRTIFLVTLASQVFQTCYAVPHCATTQSGNCIACQAGYVWLDYTCCASSVTNCNKCQFSSNNCDSCSTNFYCLAGNNRCAPCGSYLSNCLRCSSCSTCLTCSSNLVALNPSTLRCDSCSYFMSQCYQCSNPNTCTKCLTNFHVINPTTNKCQICSDFLPDCTNCLSIYQCIACSIDPGIVLNFAKCLQCKYIISKCITCSSIYQCTLCRDLYALVPNGGNITCAYCMDLMADCRNCSSNVTCIKCIVGSIVKFGCSSVPGCTEVTYTSPFSVCTNCRMPEFFGAAFNGTCLCTVGHLAGRYCTEVVGCSNIMRNVTGDYCTTCNSTLHFQFLDSNTCICMPYFEREGQLCRDICGDGMLFELPCDDGNLINGDGCSSSCEVEKAYVCNGGYNHSKSSCVFRAKMTMKLSCINNLGQNTASLVFKVTPSISNFAKSNLSNHINFRGCQNCSMTKYSIVGSDVIVFIKFEQDVQGKYVNLSLKYDNNYIISPQSFLSFPLVQCSGKLLLYGVSYSKDGQDTMMRFISIFTWVAWLFGSYSHKMIGVETLHTVQLIFIMQVFSARYSPVGSYFSQLNSVLNGFQRLLSKDLINYSFQNFYRLGYSQGFFSNISVAASLQLLSIFIFFILFLTQMICQLRIKQGERPKPRKSNRTIEKLRAFIYNFLVFPVTCGLFFNLFLSLMIRYSNSPFETVGTLFTLITTSLIFFSQFKVILISQRSVQPLSSTDKYVAIYLRNLLILSVVVCTTVSRITQQATYVLAGAEVMNCVFLLTYRHYTGYIHIVGLIVNQMGIFLNILWILSQQFVDLSQNADEIIAFVLMAWIILIIVWSFVRAIYQIRNSPKVHQTHHERKNSCKTEKLQQKEDIEKILANNESEMINYFAKQKLLQTKQFQNQSFSKNLALSIEPQKQKSLHTEIRVKFQA